MNITHDDNAQTWRDLADALTPEPVAYIEDWESRPDEPPRADGSPRPYADHQRGLLFTAREFVGQNAAASLFADVPPPPDEGVHHHWEHDGDGKWRRFFCGDSRKCGEIEFFVSGFQYTDGSIERWITVTSADSISAPDARDLAALLVQTAAELDRLTGGTT